MKFKSTLILFLLLSLTFWSNTAQAQDPEFSQFYNAPAHLNPAMIGFSLEPRFVMNYRRQWPDYDNAFNTIAVSYDQQFYSLNSAFGISVLTDRSGGGIYNTFYGNVHYAYQLSLSNKISLKAGGSLGFVQKSINQSKLIYFDQLNPVIGYDPNLQTNEAPLARRYRTTLDLGMGALAYTPTFYLGFSVKHITTPSLSFSNSEDPENRLSVRTSIHLGKVFYLGDNTLGRIPFYITPNFLFINQARFNQVIGGTYFGKGLLFGGIWYKHTLENSSSIIALFGVRASLFKISYSYDFNASPLKVPLQTHEIAISIDLGKTPEAIRRNRLQRGADCPEVFKP